MKKTNKKPRMTVLAVPCDRTFVVASEKAEEFKNLRNSPEDREFVRKCAEKLRVNNLVNEEPAKPKILNMSLKKR